MEVNKNPILTLYKGDLIGRNGNTFYALDEERDVVYQSLVSLKSMLDGGCFEGRILGTSNKHKYIKWEKL